MILLAAVVGLVCGSFANVLIVRVPSGEQWTRGSSRCPRCGHDIAWYDNVPVVSWVVLRGRCRACEERISGRYPLVEVVVAALFALVVWRFGVSILTLVFVYLATVSVALSAIDFEHRRLPNVLTYPAYVVVAVGAAAHALVTTDVWVLARAGIGLVALGGFYFLMRLLSRGGMGRGDVVTAGFLGMALGAVSWEALAVGAIAGPLVGGIAGVAAMIATRRARGVRIPYGPWLIGGAWIGILGGAAIADWYLDVATFSLR